MKFPMGFVFHDASKDLDVEPLIRQKTVPVKSLVQVHFPERNQTLTYFNDQFDLKRGDFVFVDGKLEGIRNLICSCPCGYTCKHEVAAMLQLKETLELIQKHYADLYHDYFAAIVKSDLFRFAIDGNETGSVTL